MKIVENQLIISTSPEQAIDAFTDFRLLKEWWGVARSHIEKRAGGAYALAWGLSENGFQYVSCGIVEEYLSGKRLTVRDMCYFNPDKDILTGLRLQVDAGPVNGKTVLKVIQSGYREGGDWDWYYDAVKNAWPQALEHLKTFLEAKDKH